MKELKAKIRDIPDFPKKGILFRDITTLLKDPSGLRTALDGMQAFFQNRRVDKVAGIESRGFIIGAALADRLGAGFIPVRKHGKLPAATVRIAYELEYGTDHLEMHADAVEPGERVAVVDDLLATGGTAAAAVELLRAVKAEVLGVALLVELESLGGRGRLDGVDVWSLIRYGGE